MTWQGYQFDPEPWGLTRKGLHPKLLGLDETLLALSNGNLGVRASYEQGAPHFEPGTLLNGLHETWPIVYPEPAYGFADTGQTILNLPDANYLSVDWNGVRLELAAAELIRHLDFRTGILTTTARWAEVTATWQRLVSLAEPDVHAIRVSLDAHQPGRVGVEGQIINRVDLERSGQDVQMLEPGEEVDPRQAPEFGRRVLAPAGQMAQGNTCALSYRTVTSGLPVTVGARLVGPNSQEPKILDPDRAMMRSEFEMSAGASQTVELTTAYRRDDEPAEACAFLGPVDGFEDLATRQTEAFASIWETSDIEIEGDPVAQQVVRFAIFHLIQASAALNGRSVAARGLTGRTYEGHYFWDSDVFVSQMLSATNPEAAKEVIRWRYSILPEARKRARTLSLDGALFPWRTITGEEASAFFEAGTAQFHIDADVVYGLRSYLEWTGDEDMLWECGVEIAVETARMWASLGFWDDRGYHIHGVTGPDEYTALVNDNAYTNLMARMNLRFAIDSTRRMRAERDAEYEDLTLRIGLDEDEIEEWSRIADAIVIPFDPELGITPQDSTFLTLEAWDWSTPREKYPLLLHFHPLVLYRHQMLKQADVVMAHFLLPGETSIDQQSRDYEFYDPITTGDSSLSAAVQSAVASRLGKPEDAWSHFKRAALVDLGDLAGNGASGVHIASAAGTWLALVLGFAGLAVGGEKRWPARLPDGWESMTVKLQVRGEPTTFEFG